MPNYSDVTAPDCEFCSGCADCVRPSCESCDSTDGPLHLLSEVNEYGVVCTAQFCTECARAEVGTIIRYATAAVPETSARRRPWTDIPRHARPMFRGRRFFRGVAFTTGGVVVKSVRWAD